MERVRAISWKQEGRNDHMHFQFWNGQKSVVTWKEIEDYVKQNS